MSQIPESSNPPAAAPPPQQPDQLYQAVAWVAIIAGLLLIAVSSLSVVCMFGWWY
jgi:hypothetical protein